MRRQPEEVALRHVRESDVAIFFEHQLDREANFIAAFAAEDPTDWPTFLLHWQRILSDESITARTVLVGDEVAGHMLAFQQFGRPGVSYWIGKSYWGRGIATAALRLFLQVVSIRPLSARVAEDNIGSRRVLEKCGFRVIGRDRGFAEARGEVVDELILELHAATGCHPVHREHPNEP